MIRVLIVDDQEMIRVGLRTILDSHPEVSVVADVGDGFEALRRLDSEPVDVVLMDIRMPGIDGVEATRRIRQVHRPEDLRIVILTTFDNDENVFTALRAGANGFLSKGVGPTELIAAISEVYEGRGALSAVAAAALIGHVANADVPSVDHDMAALFARLTPRESEIVAAVVAGLGNQEIAERLFLSPFTVKTHANRAMTKVGAHDRAQLVSFAIRAGIHP